MENEDKNASHKQRRTYRYDDRVILFLVRPDARGFAMQATPSARIAGARSTHLTATAAALLLVAACSDQQSSLAEEMPNTEVQNQTQPPSDPSPVKITDLGDVECEVTSSAPERLTGLHTEFDEPRTTTWTYDAARRRLDMKMDAFEFDAAGHAVRVYGSPNGDSRNVGREELKLTSTIQYDAHGRIDSYQNYDTYGVLAANVVHANTYDNDLLIAIDSGGKNAAPSLCRTYRYNDLSVPTIWTRREVDSHCDGVLDEVDERTIADRRVSLVQIARPDGSVVTENQFSYVEGRIDTLDSHTTLFADGHESYHWVRNSQKQLIEFTHDGTSISDNLFVNGIPDEKLTFSESCAPLLAGLPWLAREPDVNSMKIGSSDLFRAQWE